MPTMNKTDRQREPLIRAALYARVSSERQDVDLSVSAQLRALREYAEKNGYVVSREYVDEAESGRAANRPEFRKMLEDASSPEGPFKEILVWKFSRFTRKREHAVAFKSMLRRRGIRVVSITEHADDSPTGRLLEAIIESVDEFYSENLAQEVVRGMREAASRGFWMSSNPPYGYQKIYVRDGAKKRPRLEIDPVPAAVVRRMFDMVDSGHSILDIVRTFNREGISSPTKKRWSKTVVHQMLNRETYTGTMIWGLEAKDNAPPVRVKNAFPAIVPEAQFHRVSRLMSSRAPTKIHPWRVASSYLLSGLVKCGGCGHSFCGSAAKSGRYFYYVCQSLVKRGKESCDAPRLNARRFEKQVVDHIRLNLLTEGNVTELVKLVDEETEGFDRDQRARLEALEAEISEVRTWLDRLYRAIETSDIDISDVASRIGEHRERERRLSDAADDVRRALLKTQSRLADAKSVATFAEKIGDALDRSEFKERRMFVRSFVKAIVVGSGEAVIRYTIPMPSDDLGTGSDAEDRSLLRPVLPTVSHGDAPGTRTPNLVIKSHLLCQLS